MSLKFEEIKSIAKQTIMSERKRWILFGVFLLETSTLALVYFLNSEKINNSSVNLSRLRVLKYIYSGVYSLSLS